MYIVSHKLSQHSTMMEVKVCCASLLLLLLLPSRSHSRKIRKSKSRCHSLSCCGARCFVSLVPVPTTGTQDRKV